MIIPIMIMFTYVGLLMAFISGYLQYQIPPFLMYILLGFSFILPIVGIFMLLMRAKKTGAICLLDVGKKGKMIWFYIRKNGNVEILPCREYPLAENMAENQQNNIIIQDKKAYRLQDHQVRFVPEGSGHSANARHCLYATLCKREHGFEGLKDGRRKIFKNMDKYREQEA